MKSLFIIPLVLMSLVSSPSWALSMDDLVIRAGLYYKKFTATPFTGEIEGIFNGSFNVGKREGSWEYYHKNGQLWMKGNYKNNKAYGIWEEYYDSGQLNNKGNFTNQKKDGFWEWFNTDGTVRDTLTGTYKNGLKVSD